jgi:hypothetical protein
VGTVSKDIADKVVAGNGHYPGDENLEPYVRCVEYTDMAGKLAYGLEFNRELGKYCESAFVRNPKTYWERR